jgi:hypothetical protein
MYNRARSVLDLDSGWEYFGQRHPDCVNQVGKYLGNGIKIE